MKRFLRILVVIFTFFTQSLHSFAPTNFLKVDDPVWRLKRFEDINVCIGIGIEHGSIGVPCEPCPDENFMSVHDKTQSVLAMLENSTCQAKEQGAQELLDRLKTGLCGPDTDDGCRSHVKFLGAFRETDINIWGYYSFSASWFPGFLSFGFHLPVRTKHISNVTFKDLTQAMFATDKLIAEFIKNLASEVNRLGDLGLDDCSASGIGDLIIMLDYEYHHKPENDRIQNLLLYAKFGVLIPTSEQKDEDNVFCLPVGHDGAWGFTGGLGLCIDFEKYVRGGMSVDLKYLFDKSKFRRIKTHKAQTEFLLLNKAKVTKEHGVVWQFESFLQAHNFWRGLSFKLTYQYVQHNQSKLSLDDDDCPTTSDVDVEIMNTANSLQEARVHNLLLHAIYDFSKEFEETPIAPVVGFFYKLELSNCGFIDPNTVGGYIGVSF